MTSRIYRVRVMDAAGLKHTHDVEATSARAARRVAFRATNDETGNAVYTYDVHAVSATGGFGALYFRHEFAK